MAALHHSINVSSESPSEPLLCPLCHEVFRSPKFLPCFHTFCEHCLEDLVRQGPSSRFLCPECQEEVQVPAGGVSAFRTNFYIGPQPLERACADNVVCAAHPDKAAELYCLNCDVPICMTCFALKHKYHNHTDIAEARKKLKSWIAEGRPRLFRIIDIIKTDIDEAKEERQATREKRAALKEMILRRHAVLQAAIDKYRDEALLSVDHVTDSVLSTQDAVLASLTELLESMTKLQQRMEEAMDSECMIALGSAAKDMRFGRGSEKAEEIMAARQEKTATWPVLHFSGTTDSMLHSLRSYSGHAAKVNLTVSAPEVALDKHSVCKKDPDSDIYHLCPTTDDKVVVCFEPYMLRDEPVISVFTTEGDFVKTVRMEVPARVTSMRHRNGKVLYPTATDGSVCRFAKKCDRNMAKLFELANQSSIPGEGTFSAKLVVSEEPFVTVDTDVCTIRCTDPRAFDVDESEQTFVVLEEAQAPIFRRKVLLYKNGAPNAVAVYCSPLAPFQPSDVCFYRLGGQEVLLVADELNDAIHVVNVQNKCLVFSRYLAPDCPLLVQPTALNTDTEGRLWVGCAGGMILVFRPAHGKGAVEQQPQMYHAPPAEQLPREAGSDSNGCCILCC